MFQRGQAGADDSGLVQNLQSPIVTCDVQLVAGPPIERAAPVGANLGGDAECPQEAEGPARDGWIDDVEVNGDLSAALQVLATGGVKQPRQLGKAVARAARCDRRELVPEVFRE